MTRALAALLLLSGCADAELRPLLRDAPPPSAIRQAIDAQLQSRRTEPAPAPVPAAELDRLIQLQPLPSRDGAALGLMRDAGGPARNP